MKDLLLGIDVGTSACKVAVFDENGHVVADSNRQYNVYYPEDGWAEQDPEEWWQAIILAIHDVLDVSEVKDGKIACVGIDGQSWSAIPVDKEGNALARTPIWMDTRARNVCHAVKARLGVNTVFDVAGNDFLPSYSTPKMLWFRQEYPEIFNKTYKFSQSNSYIALKLTGLFSQDVSQLYGVHFYDLHKMEYNEALAKELGPSGIRVNAVAPGVIKTDMLKFLKEEDLQALAEETPLGRIGTPEDVAKAVAFLASENASFITGEVLNVNGGFLI